MSNLKKILVSGFILLTFLSMVRIHLPIEYTLFRRIYDKVDIYHNFFSIYQDWVMFSPDPANLDAYLTAEVVFDDGSKDQYTFPRTTDMVWIDKYLYGERYRKIVEESIRRDDHSFLWPDAAKFVLRKVKERNFHKIPLKVYLTRHWSITPNPKEKFIPHLAKQKIYQSHQFYTHEVL